MSSRLSVLHPAYKSADTLFVLPTSDGTHRDHVHYATIWTACSILLDNRQDHWLSTSRTGEPKASADATGLLAAGDYFLHVPGDHKDTDGIFPIVPNFRAWRYPHGVLPPLWAKAAQDETNRAQQMNVSLETIAHERCRITDRQLEVDNAHIIPLSEKAWFTQNRMDVYGPVSSRSGEFIADSSANLLRLRCDAHRLWDKLNFSIVPRDDHTAQGKAAWFTQAMCDGEELHKHWHFQKLQSLAGRSPQYLYARFAWDLFPKIMSFLQTGQRRHLTIFTSDGTVETRSYSGAECRQFTEGQGQNRSAGPMKRARNQKESSAAQPFDGGSDDSCDSLCSDAADSAVAGIQQIPNQYKYDTEVETEHQCYPDLCGHYFVEEERGRKRFRA